MKNHLLAFTMIIAGLIALPAFADKGGHIPPVNNDSYGKECGSCHFAYQPALLPARSWQKLMGGLSDHFGDNAELDENVQKTLLEYLVNNAADKLSNKLAKKLISRLAKNEIPARISELPYFKREHGEIPKKRVIDNPQVKSYSYCDKCHTRAETGSYAEKEINIPGYGRWED
jgi:hypothetical protein